MALNNWALPQISRLLPLDEDSLKQIIIYTETLTKPAAAEHLKNLLGDSAQALEFISSFNNRRPEPAPEVLPSTSLTSQKQTSEVPKAARRPAKAKRPLHELPARQVEQYGEPTGAYVKKRDDDDYMAARARPRNEPPLANTLALQEKPDALQLPAATKGAPIPQRQTSRLPPSAAGALISDLSSAKSSRSSSPATRSSAANTKTKIAVAGGTSMRGQSTTLNDLDSAIRSLELQTNPSLTTYSAAENAQRRCDCMAQKHPLLAAAPNCTNCGKIICAKEGLGPCTFCEKPLLSSAELHDMLQTLKTERGKERQQAHNAQHTRPEVSRAPKPFSANTLLSTPGATPPLTAATTPAESEDDEESSASLLRAKEHRDRLLAFQANNARRTRIHDEAADFETPDAGTSMWASPQERALQLKRQQKILREQEWNARPEYEKRNMVVSIDIKGGRAVKTMRRVEQPRFEEEAETQEDDDDEDFRNAQTEDKGRGTGQFSRNPLLGGLIRPVYNKAADAAIEKGKGSVVAKETRTQTTGWRKVQDFQEDNEAWILDGGAFGGNGDNAGRTLGAEEHPFGGSSGGTGYKSQVG